jgi:hypothetical protein
VKPAFVPFVAGQLALYKGTENVYSRTFDWVCNSVDMRVKNLAKIA